MSYSAALIGESVRFSKQLLFVSCLLLLSLGCSAQSNTSSSSSGLSSDAEMRIQRLIRNHKHLKEEVTLKLGTRKPSQFPGYDELPVTMSLGKNSLTENYLVSK